MNGEMGNGKEPISYRRLLPIRVVLQTRKMISIFYFYSVLTLCGSDFCRTVHVSKQRRMCTEMIAALCDGSLTNIAGMCSLWVMIFRLVVWEFAAK